MSTLGERILDNIKDYIRATLEQYNSSVYSWAQTASEYALWVSWGFSADFLLGVMLPNSVDENKPKNISEAHLLFELALQPIVTNHYFRLDRRSNRSWEVNEAATEIVRRNIQGFIFGDESEERIRLYGNFHKQYHQSLQRAFSGDQDHMSLLYCQFLEYRWLECCSGEQIIDWSKINFPCWSYEEFMAARCSNYDEMAVDLLNPYKTVTLHGIIGESYRFSNILYKIAYDPMQNANKESWYAIVLSSLPKADDELHKLPDWPKNSLRE